MKRKDVSNLRKLQYLLMAMQDYERMVLCGKKPKTNIISYACQYSSNPKLKPEDFKEMKNMKISDTINEIENNIYV